MDLSGDLRPHKLNCCLSSPPSSNFFSKIMNFDEVVCGCFHGNQKKFLRNCDRNSLKLKTELYLGQLFRVKKYEQSSSLTMH